MKLIFPWKKIDKFWSKWKLWTKNYKYWSNIFFKYFFYSREFNQDLNAPDDLVIFDTGISEHDINGDTLVRDVLLASSDAPVYFLTPKKLGSKSYIDGGIGGYQFFGN